MHKKLVIALLAVVVGVGFESGCATKKYVRNSVAERVQPLENRTSELEETSRRNSQEISQLNTQITDVRGRADKAQQTANEAASTADRANSRVASVETSVEDLRSNLDKYSVLNSAMVFFRPGSDKLTREAMAQLDQLASQITDRNGFVLEITGFGDTARATRYNQNLAQLRAEAVQRYLADKDNVPVMRMFAIGFGSARPANENVSTGAQGAAVTGQTEHAQMRRVDIKLLTNNAVPNNGNPTSGGQAARKPDQRAQSQM
jgi:peptidoglycan-associated lipoprotein